MRHPFEEAHDALHPAHGAAPVADTLADGRRRLRLRRGGVRPGTRQQQPAPRWPERRRLLRRRRSPAAQARPVLGRAPGSLRLAADRNRDRGQRRPADRPLRRGNARTPRRQPQRPPRAADRALARRRRGLGRDAPARDRSGGARPVVRQRAGRQPAAHGLQRGGRRRARARLSRPARPAAPGPHRRADQGPHPAARRRTGLALAGPAAEPVQLVRRDLRGDGARQRRAARCSHAGCSVTSRASRPASRGVAAARGTSAPACASTTSPSDPRSIR